jgi:hypothetical protein
MKSNEENVEYVLSSIQNVVFRLAQAMMREECNDESINEDVEAVKKRFKWLSWNIDGLDPSNLETRTRGVITVIAK